MLKLENLAGERQVIGQLILCFWSTTGNDVIMMSLPVKALSGDETSSEERDITLL